MPQGHPLAEHLRWLEFHLLSPGESVHEREQSSFVSLLDSKRQAMAVHSVPEHILTHASQNKCSGWMVEAPPALWGNEYIALSMWAASVPQSELKVSAIALGEVGGCVPLGSLEANMCSSLNLPSLESSEVSTLGKATRWGTGAVILLDTVPT